MDIFPLFRLRNLASRLWFRLAIAPFLGHCGPGTAAMRLAGLEGARAIHLGRDIFIAEGAILAAVNRAGGTEAGLHVDDRCSLGRHNHIYATRRITIEAGVLTAANVYIADNTHSFADAGRPIRDQPVAQLAEVRIGAGSWLGQNVCVIGASVGKGCVIGANSVVLTDVPDYCVAVGAPARVVKRLDHSTGQWTKPTD